MLLRWFGKALFFSLIIIVGILAFIGLVATGTLILMQVYTAQAPIYK